MSKAFVYGTVAVGVAIGINIGHYEPGNDVQIRRPKIPVISTVPQGDWFGPEVSYTTPHHMPPKTTTPTFDPCNYGEACYDGPDLQDLYSPPTVKPSTGSVVPSDCFGCLPTNEMVI